MIYWLDADLNGIDSIASRIKEGSVVRLPCDGYEAFDNHVTDLIPRVTSDDLVVIDTLTNLMLTSITDFKLGTDASVPLWPKRRVYMEDPDYLNVYQAGTRLIMRRIRNLAARDARLILVCHESSSKDDATLITRRAPALNKALREAVEGATSDIFRLSVTYEDRVNSEGKVVLKAYSRVLQLWMDDEVFAKYHVEEGEKSPPPKFIYHPTLPKIYDKLHKKPSCLCLYGAPGTGKTVLATSEKA